jgi:hypothetical protein
MDKIMMDMRREDIKLLLRHAVELNELRKKTSCPPMYNVDPLNPSVSIMADAWGIHLRSAHPDREWECVGPTLTSAKANLRGHIVMLKRILQSDMTGVGNHRRG